MPVVAFQEGWHGGTVAAIHRGDAVALLVLRGEGMSEPLRCAVVAI
jgi:hypothetical protein